MSVLLIDGESPFSSSICYCLSAANRPIHLGSTTRFPDARFSRLRKKFCWWQEESQLLTKIRDFALQERVDVIMACSDSGIRFLSENRKELASFAALAGTPSVDILAIAGDKAKFAEFLGRVRLPHPETAIAAGRELPGHLPRFPVLLKPARGSGGAGIIRFDDVEALRLFVNDGGLGERHWILQSYLYGRDIDCSLLCRNGDVLAYTIQSSADLPARSFAPIGPVEFVEDAEVLKLARKLVGELQWTGIAHIDMLRAEADGCLYLIEMNGRYWSSLIGSFRAGVNFPELACLDALSKTFLRPTQKSIRFVRGGLGTAWREARHPAETTLSWRLLDPGPLLASYVASKTSTLPTAT